LKDRYADYSTGYASVPGLSYERSEWITEVIGRGLHSFT
jgi:all-trans-8'-apo-beta-carotenal 15,15'-oxygenase